MAQPLLSILAGKNIISANDVSSIETEAREAGVSVEETLRKRGVAETDILAAKGEYLRIPTRSIESTNIPFEILRYIPEESAAHYGFVPIGLADGALEVGIVEPDNIEARDALYFISSKINLPFKLFLISEEDFKGVLDTYKGLSGEVTKALSEISGDAGNEEADLGKEQTQDLTGSKKSGEAKIIEDAPVTKIVATILRYAIEGQASDIHIEALAEKTRVRFRIDGELHTSLVLPANVHRSVVARIKILSNMKLDEHRKPQDGRFSAKIDGLGGEYLDGPE
jgi:type IV pilus assembly protein PilB